MLEILGLRKYPSSFCSPGITPVTSRECVVGLDRDTIPLTPPLRLHLHSTTTGVHHSRHRSKLEHFELIDPDLLASARYLAPPAAPPQCHSECPTSPGWFGLFGGLYCPNSVSTAQITSTTFPMEVPISQISSRPHIFEFSEQTVSAEPRNPGLPLWTMTREKYDVAEDRKWRLQ